VVDGAVHPFDVGRRRGQPFPGRSSQDLESTPDSQCV